MWVYRLIILIQQRLKKAMFFFVNNYESTLTLIHQNIAGALTKRDEISFAILDLVNSNIRVDVLCLTETFLLEGTEKNFRLKGFTTAAYYSRKTSKRGGVTILVKMTLNLKLYRKHKKYVKHVYSNAVVWN